jgi:hypothetical protein
MKQKWGFNMTDLSDFDDIWKRFSSDAKNYRQIMGLMDDYEEYISEWKVKDLCFHFYLLGKQNDSI